MKETDFIKQNKQKWARFEKLSANNNNDPDEVSELFTEITEDLSYAKTFYPRRSVRVYLNQLSQGVFTSLYKQRKEPIGNFLKFWTEVVPLEMYRARRNLLVSFCFFALTTIVGIVSQEYDPDFVKIVLGESYVSSTEHRIENGDPMGIYGESSQGSMFFRITVNNIRVAFLAFVGGIFFTLGTYWVLLKNGIMLGAFQWWFKAKGLLFTSFLAVWIHGAFEISAIVIAGAAGLTVGNGLIFPRSFSRIQSLIFSAKRGFVILISLVPFFICAGALESYVTRHYLTMPTALKLTIILGSLAIILFYYVYFPYRVAKKIPHKLNLKEIPRFIPARQMKWFKLRNPGEIFTDTFTLFIAKASKLSRLFFNLILPFFVAIIVFIFIVEGSRFDYTLSWNQTLGTLFGTGGDFEVYKLLGWPLPFALLLLAGYFVVQDHDEDKLLNSFVRFSFKHILWMYLFTLLIFSIMIFSPGIVLFFAILLAPFLTMIPSLIVIENKNFFSAFAGAFDLGKGGYGDLLVSNLSMIAITMIFFMILHNPFEFGILMIIDDLLRDALVTNVDNYRIVISVVNTVVYVFFMFIMFSLYAISFKLGFFSINERKSASGLYERLQHFGKRSRSYETELDFE